MVNLKYFIEQFEEMSTVVKNAEKISLFLDYDGTLSKIASTPSEAKLPDSVRTLLKNIARNNKVQLAIISGRPIEELKQMVRVDGVYYAGNHGFEIDGPNFRFLHPLLKKYEATLSSIAKRLRTSLSSFEGILIEEKGATISVHYRMVDEGVVPKVKATFLNVTHEIGDIRVTEGKMVLEVRPRIDWDKGKAATKILEKFAVPGLVFYIGDDQTDEDAFRALESHYTIRVLNGKTDSQARYYLNTQKEVQEFLIWLGTNL